MRFISVTFIHNQQLAPKTPASCLFIVNWRLAGFNASLEHVLPLSSIICVRPMAARRASATVRVQSVIASPSSVRASDPSLPDRVIFHFVSTGPVLCRQIKVRQREIESSSFHPSKAFLLQHYDNTACSCNVEIFLF